MATGIDLQKANFGRVLSLIARQWRRAVDLRLQPYGLTEATWLPLLRLARAPEPMRQKDLAAALGLDKYTVVRLHDNQQAAGLVARREGDSDRRAKAIFLTGEGRATVDKVEAVARQVRDEVFAALNDGHVAIAFQVLEHIGGALGRMTEREEG
ncbi:MAG: MarR family transcriptional regulator [Rhodospirillales bacterium]|nr:MarR family transcriptional regulator [Rhodospirillales bacterium]